MHDEDGGRRSSRVGRIASPSDKSCRAGAVVGRARAETHETSQIPDRNTPTQAVASVTAKTGDPSSPPLVTGVGAARDSNKETTGSIDTTKVSKRDLLKRKKIDTTNCHWVQCNTCDQWVHTVCALLNNSVNKRESTEFFCSVCRLRAREHNAKRPAPGGTDFRESPKSPKRTIDQTADKDASNQAAKAAPVTINDEKKTVHENQRKETEKTEPAVSKALATENLAAEAPSDAINVYRASSLSRTHLSAYLEERVRNRLTELGEGAAAKSITVRLLSNVYATFDTPDVFRTVFKTKGGLGEGPGEDEVQKAVRYTSKAIAMFQRIGAGDVYVFSMYTQEYNADAPYFNQRRAYVAYVDSVDHTHLQNRTAAYKEMLVGYMDWLRNRSFKSVHLWVCRPSYGDSFIFWIRPRYQKIPEQARLTEWYWDIARRAIELGVASNAMPLCEMAPFTEMEPIPATSASPPCASGNRVDRRLQVPALFDGDYLQLQGIELAKTLGTLGKTEDLSQALTLEVKRMSKRLLVIELAPPGVVCASSGGSAGNASLIETRHTSTPQSIMPSPTDNDPDPVISRPLVDKLDVFLNTCQLHHFQFDTLAGAKHSTAMILYHLHEGDSRSLESHCVRCSLPLHLVRFHCPHCDTETCSDCEKALETKCEEGHLLVPYQLPRTDGSTPASGNAPATDGLA